LRETGRASGGQEDRRALNLWILRVVEEIDEESDEDEEGG